MISGTARDALGDHLDLAESVGAALVSVEYRLAPETPHPGPVEDCYAGLLWIVENAARAGDRRGADRARRRQRRRRPRGRCRPARPRPGRPGAGRPAADVPDARRPQRHPFGAPDGRPADVEPAGERGRLDGAARGRRGWSGRLALRRAGPRRGSLRPAADLRRRRLDRHLPRRGRRLRRPASGWPAASRSCTSGRAASTASAASRRTRPSRGPQSPRA